MKKFLSGVLCATLVFSLALSALAISGNVSFNLSTIKFNGQVISEAGEGYTLSNGCVAPASITYTDEKGGGTTYLPVRRIGELAGVTIDWDGAVVVKTQEFVEQEKREAERAAALDYSDWSAEDEAAYQEFKGLWKYTFERATSTWNSKVTDRAIYLAELKDETTQFDASQLQEDAKYNMILRRAAEEVNTSGYQNVTIRYPFGLISIVNGGLDINLNDVAPTQK